MYLHKTKNGHYTPPCCYFSGELEVVEILRSGLCGKRTTANAVDNDFCSEAARAVRYDSDFIWQTEPWPVREYILSEKDKNAIKLSELRTF